MTTDPSARRLPAERQNRINHRPPESKSSTLPPEGGKDSQMRSEGSRHFGSFLTELQAVTNILAMEATHVRVGNSDGASGGDNE